MEGWVPALEWVGTTPCLGGWDLRGKNGGRDGAVGLGGRAVREPPLRERMLSGTGFTPIPRLHEGRL